MRGIVAGALAAALLLSFSATAAQAGPGDLDPTFGNAGLAALPTGERYNAEGAPLLDPSGRIYVAGLLRNASDRVFLARFTNTGAPDASYGSAGEVHTTVVSAARRAATATLGDGRVLVAGATERPGRIAIERYLASGAIDTTYGKDRSGRIYVDLGGTHAIPRAIVPLPDGKALVAVANDLGGTSRFTVVKLTPTGLDTTFASRTGIARIAFPVAAATHGLALVEREKIVVAGSVGSEGAASSDTALARLNPDGSLDTKTFGLGGPEGDGKVVADLAAGQADHAAAAATSAPAGVVVAGPAASDGMVARFSSTGALEMSRVGGFGARDAAGAAGAFAPADVIVDSEGRPVVTGTTRFGSGLTSTYRWTVARLTTAGAFDGSFGGGRVGLSACDNRAGFGPSGITAKAARLLVLGSCGEQGAVAVMRLFADKVLRSGVTLNVNAPSEAAGRRRIPLGGIDPTAALGNTALLTGQSLRNAPLTRSPLTRSPLTRSPLTRSPLTRSPLTRSPLTRSPLTRSPLTRSPIGPILLSSIPLTRSSWEEVLKPFNLDVPWQTLTLDDVINQAPGALDGLTLADIPLERTPLANVSYSAVLFGWTALPDLPAPPAPATDWCDFIKDMPVKCTADQGAENLSLLDLEVGGNDLTKYYTEPLSLRAVNFAAAGSDREAPLSTIPLNAMAIARTPFGNVPAAEVWELMAGCSSAGDCTGTVAERQAAAEQANNPDSFSTKSLGELIAKLPLPSLPDVTFGQVLTGLLPVYDIPYERTPLRAMLSQADVRADRLVGYTASASVDCAQSGSDLRAEVRLPDGARYVRGSAQINGVPAADPTESAAKLVFDLAPGCANATTVRTLALTFAAEPGFALGPVETAAEVLAGSESAAAKVASRVDDSLDTPDAKDGAQDIDVDKIVTGHISNSEDVDAYRFKLPEAGSLVQVTLRVPKKGDRGPDEVADPDADFDVYLHTPAAALESAPLTRSPLTRSPLTRSPLTRSSVPDTSRETATGDGVLAPDGLQDMPLTRSELGRTPLTRSSINRGDEPESVTIEVNKSEAGQYAYIRVAGYNGSFSRYPYAMRVRAMPGASPASCRATNLPSAGQNGAWAEQIPASTQSIILFNQRRFSARFPTQAGAVRTRLESFAQRVNGVVISPESFPNPNNDPALDVNDAGARWDADPCSPAAANLVVQRTANVLDRVMVDGDGNLKLKELRHLMIVGTDDVMPMLRVKDGSVLANEWEYANDAVFGNEENPISAAQRQGFVLTDDAIADSDPQTRPGGALYVPDLAVGRVVETPNDITRQLTRFERSQGILDPKTANTFGYDFLSDGSKQVADELAKIASGTTNLGEDWNANTALGAMNGSGAQFGSYNAHYDHYRAQPAAEFHGTDTALIHANQATPAKGSLLFNMGCHGGLSIPDVVVSVPTGDEAERLVDWPQALNSTRPLEDDNGVLYAANTGYGYGDTDVVAYGERLAALFAKNLATKKMTAAQASMYAKQEYAGSLGIGDDYDAKTVNQFTFYGPPMYQIAGGETARPALPEAPTGTVTRFSAQTVKLPSTLAERTAGDRGKYFVSVKDGKDEPPLVVQHRPIQPRAQHDVTQRGGAPAHGFLLDHVETREVPNFDPVFALPTIDFSGNEPEQSGVDAVFPATTQSVQSIQTPEGRRDVLDLVLGQFRDEAGQRTQILTTNAKGRVLRSWSTDYAPPEIERVTTDLVPGGVVFNVWASEDADGGTILYRTDQSAAWLKVDLAVTAPGRLGGAAVLPSGTEKVFDGNVQVFDAAGNVGVSKNKVVGHFASLGSAGGSTPRFEFSPEGVKFHNSSVTIKLVPDDPTATFEYSIDGEPYRAYDGAFTYAVSSTGAQDGTHVLRARGSNGSQTIAVFGVDTVGPTVDGAAQKSPSENGWYNEPVVVDFFCADAASGVASCPNSAVINADGKGLFTDAVTATDVMGHVSAPFRAGPFNIDRTPPTISGAADRAPEYTGAPKRWWKDSLKVQFTCADALSGVAGNCPAEVVLGHGDNQSVKRTVRDLANNEASVTVDNLNVDARNPVPTITSTQRIFLPSQRLAGTATDGAASDPQSGVASVTVDYIAQGGFGTTQRDVKTNLSCSDGELRRTCTWDAPLPPLGNYQAVARARDRVGHVVDSQATFFSVSLG